MSKQYEELQKAYKYYRSVTDFEPKVAVILGSGLGAYADHLKVVCEIPYGDFPGFPVSTVQGHAGRFILGYVDEVPVVLMKGRVHYYEGYPMEKVVMPVRLMRLMGAEVLLLTNAAGGINLDFQAGDFMMITDQISSFVPSPLVGENIEELGERFPDMTYIYDPELQQVIRTAAGEEGVGLREGVYVQASGPNFESPAEIRMFRNAGADAVGMSTACEAVAARHAGMRIGGISFISNMASGITKETLSDLDVQKAAAKSSADFERLLTTVIKKAAELQEERG
jgi:purine-nucleoside phosphorylase